MTDPQAAAVHDNAGWCDVMCRAHGVPGTYGDGRVWASSVRTPVFYPDAVTLSPGATAEDVLARIDAGPGASVKDSYAALDLPGFEVLFEAQWIHRPAPRPAGTAIAWEVVGDAATLREWERAAFGGEVTGLFLPALLKKVRIVCARIGGEIVCGSVLTASGGVAGVSNVFASGCDPDTAWAGTLAMAAHLLPGRPLVGYESDLEVPLGHGFTPVGPLRVWLRP
ncbi:hypothetical protein FE391_46540 [Nonomuraea sp. KC401]|uniref:hypothetical protein n=1 Tax=unclassified Nonomuraea TaxID=2593643 RepID=UPI0010FCE2D1|nr:MULTISPECIES: hypothetical protein [unclassified Nonomuraea]NBF00570.1 hypothetical protein [Nonomuraea sp. K271]TLF46046.1 hypothetical protein FE391_46540 [Nonomuraea sp. KC401]